MVRPSASDRYNPALVLSYLCAPNYRYIFRQLDSATAGWRDLGCRRVLDLAGGHGLLLLHTLHQLPEAVGIEVDLSASAQTFSQRLQQVTGWGEGRFECQVRDFFDADPSMVEPFDVAICCELLEHLPEPREHCRRCTLTFVPAVACSSRRPFEWKA